MTMTTIVTADAVTDDDVDSDEDGGTIFSAYLVVLSGGVSPVSGLGDLC